MTQESQEPQLTEVSVKPKRTYKKRMPKKTSIGLGDTIEKITQATGIKAIVEAVTDDCGCEERKKKLNQMFSYETKMMSSDDKLLWETCVRPAWQRGNMKSGEQYAMIKIYENVFPEVKRKLVNCGGCLQGALKKLEAVYENSCE
jgi:hypothetical protein